MDPMQIPVPNLSWLRTFEASARHLNFTSAGQEIGMTQAAVSQQIKALESKLGCDLFVRNHRALSLTDMGRAYLPAVQKAMNDLALSTNGLFGPGFDDLVTVRAPVSTALLCLAPRLHAFRSEYPKTRVRLVSSFRNNDLSGERVDVEIRLGHGNWEGVQAEKLSGETLVPIIQKGTAQQFSNPDAFLTIPLIHIIGFDDNWTQYFHEVGHHGQTGSFGVSVDTSAAAIDLVATGEGCAIVLERFARSAMEQGRNIELGTGNVRSSQSHFLVTPHKDLNESQLAKDFKNWVRLEMASS